MTVQDQVFTNLINVARRFLDKYLGEYRFIAAEIAIMDYASYKTCLDLGINDPVFCDEFWTEALRSGEVVRIKYEIDEKKLRDLVEKYRYLSEQA